MNKKKIRNKNLYSQRQYYIQRQLFMIKTRKGKRNTTSSTTTEQLTMAHGERQLDQ